MPPFSKVSDDYKRCGTDDRACTIKLLAALEDRVTAGVQEPLQDRVPLREA